MRLTILVLISLATTSAAGAETLRLPPSEQPQSGKALPLKGTAGSARANGCTAYGRGFTWVEATGTCVKIGGAVRVDGTVGR
ncbi:porin [Bradyrhizobium sp. AZCC 2230]|uniref:porin n=1 Tax=Bradyrhizobium sp. AZCC 2230 TaxID=3117021 RepID=UPI002FF27EC9